MADPVTENNKAVIIGQIYDEPEFSHEMYGEGFYNFFVKVPRLSENSDYLPVTVSERLLEGIDTSIGNEVMIEGQLRSYNKYIDGSNRLVLTVFARDIKEHDPKDKSQNPNQIYIDGYICKPTIYRTTPFKREITDMLIAVNRPYNKSDYIPAISWGRNAKYCDKLKVGDRIRLWGRIQSREYQKKLSEDCIVTKTAYEISVIKIEKVQV